MRPKCFLDKPSSVTLNRRMFEGQHYITTEIVDKMFIKIDRSKCTFKDYICRHVADSKKSESNTKKYEIFEIIHACI